MQLLTNALVIREKRLEEHDRLLTLLTPDKGVITAYARGATRLKGGMVSCTEQLCYSSFKLFWRGDRVFVDNAESDTIFFGLRQDLDKLSLATYFCQLCTELVPPLDANDQYLRLMLNCLHYLEKNGMDRRLLKPLFELRILSLSGYQPDLSACAVCGGLCAPLWLSPQGGTLYCDGCRPADASSLIPLTDGVFQAMRHILYSDFTKLFHFKLSQAGAAELCRVSKQYMLAQVERVLPALNYYETIVGK
ncbi:MAG: DNA repair protein RecO [Angelakisella sp.]